MSDNPMFVYDEEMAEAVFDYCRWRLSLDPVPLDHTVPKATLEAILSGLVTAGGKDPVEILSIFTDRVVTSVISCDSPRFLAFVPAAPTKAALLFDMVVSASCLQGTSWLEAAGTVIAENQVLSFLAELAGMPPSSGGCFVSGGSAANLSALVVARDRGRARLGGPTAQVRVALGEDAHSSVSKALHIIGVGELLVPCDDHRLTGAGLEEALRVDPDPSNVVAVVASAGTTNAGLVDDLAGLAEVARQRDLWFHIDAAYGARPCCRGPPKYSWFSEDPSTPIRSSSTPTNGCLRPLTVRLFCTGSQRWLRRSIPNRRPTSTLFMRVRTNGTQAITHTTSRDAQEGSPFGTHS